MALLVTRPNHDPVDRRVLHSALSRLEPCAVKIACTVLRGRGGSNATLLPDYAPSLRSPWRAAVAASVWGIKRLRDPLLVLESSGLLDGNPLYLLFFCITAAREEVLTVSGWTEVKTEVASAVIRDSPLLAPDPLVQVEKELSFGRMLNSD